MENKNYSIINEEQYLSIKLMGICDFQNIKQFMNEIKTFLENPPHIVVSCELLSILSKDWLREMAQIQNTLKKCGRLLRLTSVNNDLKKFIKDNGLDSVFKIVNNIKEALSDFGLAKKKMIDTEFINPFLTATLHVLKVQASITAESGKIFVKKPEDKYVGDISGVIGIVSDSFDGNIIISFPEKTFLNVMSGMLGEEYKEMNQEILDGAGEITNMIFGQAKIVLNEKGYGIKTALPSIVTGKNHSMTSNSKGPVVIVPFTSSAGDFFVVICLSG